MNNLMKNPINSLMKTRWTTWWKTDKQPVEQPDTANMPDLESEIPATQRNSQLSNRLKILTPHQIINRLSITLAQVYAGNNSQKIKSEIRWIIYYLHIQRKQPNQFITNLSNQ